MLSLTRKIKEFQFHSCCQGVTASLYMTTYVKLENKNLFDIKRKIELMKTFSVVFFSLLIFTVWFFLPLCLYTHLLFFSLKNFT